MEGYNITSRLDIRTKEKFREALRALMDLRGIETKTEAIEIAVEQTLQRSLSKAEGPETYQSWLGAAKNPAQNTSPQFKSHDELWGETS